MITSDASFVDDQIRRFNQTMDFYREQMKLAPKACVKRQAGLLVRTLINITPPSNPNKTKERIAEKVGGTFNTAKREYAAPEGGKQGHGQIRWYAWNSTSLYGVAKDVDFRSKSVDDLEAYWNLKKKISSKGGLIIAGKRGNQTIKLRRKILADANRVKELIKRIQTHVGRLKAAWGVSWMQLGRPGGNLPKYVADKIDGARSTRHGWYIDGLGIKDSPTFTIANRAAGVANLQKKSGELLRRALDIRSKAMESDIAFAVRNPTKWKEREAQIALDQTIREM